MAKLIQKAVNAVIRPPRTVYDDSAIPLVLEADDGRTFVRYPVSFRNDRHQSIVGSIYHSRDFLPFDGGPCVIYMHGNASSQLEGQFLVPNLCPYGVFVFCFDFAGCGCSGGDYVSLGWFEKEDTEFIIDILHRTFKMGPFVVWGRSMGASTALLVKSPLLVGRVIDSAFTSVRDMCSAIASSMKLPSAFVGIALWYLNKRVLKTAKFSINEVTPIEVDNPDEVPAVFGHAANDQFIPYEQCNRLYKHYQNDRKYLMELPGGHNSKREIQWIQLGVCFCFEQLDVVVKDLNISECRKLQESVFHFPSFAEMVNQAAPETETEQEDLIEQFRSENPEIGSDLSEEAPVEDLKKKRKHKKHHTSDHDDTGDQKKKKKRRKHRASEDDVTQPKKRRRHHSHITADPLPIDCVTDGAGDIEVIPRSTSLPEDLSAETDLS